MARKTKAQIAEALRKEAKRISDRNYRFRKLPKDKQRIVIAKDVLELLKAEKILATSGTYLEFDEDVQVKYFGDEDYRYWDDESGAQAPIKGADRVKLHKLIEESPTCEVCGIGACFVAAVRRADKVKVGDLEDSNDDDFMRKYLKQWFDKDQLGLIECAFECGTGWSSGQAAYDAMEFGSQFDDDGERLEAIFKNIVENNGKFVPPESSESRYWAEDDDDEDESWY